MGKGVTEHESQESFRDEAVFHEVFSAELINKAFTNGIYIVKDSLEKTAHVKYIKTSVLIKTKI